MPANPALWEEAVKLALLILLPGAAGIIIGGLRRRVGLPVSSEEAEGDSRLDETKVCSGCEVHDVHMSRIDALEKTQAEIFKYIDGMRNDLKEVMKDTAFLVGRDTNLSESKLHSVPRAERSKTVLVVEDLPLVRFTLETYLSQIGCTVTSAESVGEAMEALGGSSYNVAIVDASLTDGQFDGLELIEHILDNVPGTRVVLVSGFIDKIKKVDHRIHAIIPKPFTLEQIAQAVA